MKNPGNTFCVVCFDIEKVNGRLIVNINRKEQKRISNEVEEEQCFVENAEHWCLWEILSAQAVELPSIRIHIKQLLFWDIFVHFSFILSESFLEYISLPETILM